MRTNFKIEEAGGGGTYDDHELPKDIQTAFMTDVTSLLETQTLACCCPSQPRSTSSSSNILLITDFSNTGCPPFATESRVPIHLVVYHWKYSHHPLLFGIELSSRQHLSGCSQAAYCLGLSSNVRELFCHLIVRLQTPILIIAESIEIIPLGHLMQA